VLAAIAGSFGRHGVSILSMHQEGRGDTARLIFVTHTAREADLRATMHEVRELDVVARIGTILRVIGSDA
jgi:homoserine dehydrogenase